MLSETLKAKVAVTSMVMTIHSHFISGVRHVSGIEIYTPSELEAANGTDVRLKCTFSTSHPVTLQTVTVSWNFRPLNSGTDESVCRNCVDTLNIKFSLNSSRTL